MKRTPDELYDLLEQFIGRLMCMGETESMDTMIETDLSFSQARTLFVLAQCGDSVPIHVVAEKLRMSVAATGRNADQLVGLGLVERHEDAEDRRVRRIALTESGCAIARKHVDAKRQGLRAFVERLGDDDRERLAASLEPILAGDSLRPRPAEETT